MIHCLKKLGPSLGMILSHQSGKLKIVKNSNLPSSGTFRIWPFFTSPLIFPGFLQILFFAVLSSRLLRTHRYWIFISLVSVVLLCIPFCLVNSYILSLNFLTWVNGFAKFLFRHASEKITRLSVFPLFHIKVTRSVHLLVCCEKIYILIYKMPEPKPQLTNSIFDTMKKW